MTKILLLAGSLINLAMAVFHMFFWKLFNWSEELPKLAEVNSGILQIANIIIIFILLYFALMSFLISRSGELDFNGASIFACVMGFYLIRIFTGMAFFGFTSDELIVWAVCLLITLLYGIIIVRNRRALKELSD
ncbi:MAG TPA: hypothetical protein PK926_14420 [Spirochaetota bacterium]|nr:hypothetical protein [Spirochaetota bacterium]HPI91182.1 hypothetical protein [Spirochaetota bacterium]HPR49470.1 hypothetical protein [Spirochaetota bacterium]